MTAPIETALGKYLAAVLVRKPLLQKMSGQSVNHAELMQLQDDDVPRLVAIIRHAEEKLGSISTWTETTPPSAIAGAALLEMSAIAAKGSSAKWGDCAPSAGQFRSRPVLKEAFQWNGPETALPAWMAGKGWALTEDHLQLLIPTLEGTMAANRGDWVIKGLRGEVYPCKPDIFAGTYEPA